MINSVRLGLYLGQAYPSAAPATAVTALQQVTVQQDDSGSQGFSLSFNAERGWGAQPDYALLREPRLKTGSRVIVTVTLNATPFVLMDGIISQVQVAPAQGDQAATITVSGQDLSTLLDLVDVNLTIPIPSLTAVIAAILLKYAPLGLLPQVIPPLKEVMFAPTERLFFQEGTDLAYLRRTAQDNGYIFAIRPGPTPGLSRAYWGPLIKFGAPQKALTVDMGHASNVTDLSFEMDSLKPTQVYGLLAKPGTAVPIPILGLTNINPPPLARKSPFLVNQPYVRKERLAYSGDSVTEAYLQAQARVDESADGVVTARGTLDALRYGAILRAPGIVGLRGAGDAHDGLYYVKSVTHTISKGQYQQAFVLGREGLGTTVNRITP